MFAQQFSAPEASTLNPKPSNVRDGGLKGGKGFSTVGELIREEATVHVCGNASQRQAPRHEGVALDKVGPLVLQITMGIIQVENRERQCPSVARPEPRARKSLLKVKKPRS